jgi:tRNA(Ile)-lysidine synthase
LHHLPVIQRRLQCKTPATSGSAFLLGSLEILGNAHKTLFRYHVPVLKSFQHFVRQHRLIAPGDRVGVAVSGGADSIAMLRAVAELAPELGIVPLVLHFNHKLRGADSEADAEFVAALASQLGLQSALESGDVAALAAHSRLSLEAAGRRARYEFFLRAATAHRLDCVATAHTRDDQAETVLLHLLRGAGTSGLAGIHRSCSLAALACPASATGSDETPCRSREAGVPRLIRPMLSTTRQQVEQFLLSLGQPFRQDSSNLSPRFLRNRVRADLLPALERDYNPQLRQALYETAEIAAAENAFLEELVSAAFDPQPVPGSAVAARDCESPAATPPSVELQRLNAQPVALQRRILRRLCQPFGLALDFAQLEALRNFAQAGRAGCLQLPRGFAAEVVRPRLHPARLHLRTRPPI